jgi:hypothetical protein
MCTPRDSALACLIALLVTAAGCTPRDDHSAGAAKEGRPRGPGPVTVELDEPDPMLRSLGAAFRERNPGIASVSLLEFRRVSEGAGANFVLARGLDPRGRTLEDELFGVFMFDDSLVRIVRTIDVFSSPRWLDYAIRIERANAETLVVVGRAMSSSEDSITRVYRWAR